MQEIIETELTSMFGQKATVETYLETIPVRLLSLGIRIAVIVVLLILGSWIIRCLCGVVRKSLEKSKIENGSINFITATVKAILYCILIAILAGYFGVDAASIVTILGSLGLTLGLAAQGSLSNFAGGLLILISKPFKIGDYISESTHGTEGSVYEIHMFYTKLKTRDNRVVVIPNGELANATLTDFSALKERRVDLRVMINYGEDTDRVRQVIMEVLNASQVSEHDRKVYVSEFESSGIEMGIEFYVKNKEFLDKKRLVLEEILKAFDREGIVIPFEQIDVHMV